jgi:hypothetical protein
MVTILLWSAISVSACGSSNDPVNSPAHGTTSAPSTSPDSTPPKASSPISPPSGSEKPPEEKPPSSAAPSTEVQTYRIPTLWVYTEVIQESKDTLTQELQKELNAALKRSKFNRSQIELITIQENSIDDAPFYLGLMYVLTPHRVYQYQRDALTKVRTEHPKSEGIAIRFENYNKKLFYDDEDQIRFQFGFNYNYIFKNDNLLNQKYADQIILELDSKHKLNFQ